MTHYAQLAEAVEPARSLDEGLVLRGSRASLDALVNYFLADDLEGLREKYPDVSNYHVEQVTEIFADILRDVPNERRARQQLLNQAAWALLSERASRLIEREVADLSDPPEGVELLALARRALAYLEPEAGSVASRADRHKTKASEPPGTQYRSSVPRNRSSETLEQVLAEFTDVSSRIRNVADQVQRTRPVHSSYARELANRLDEIVSELAAANE